MIGGFLVFILVTALLIHGIIWINTNEEEKRMRRYLSALLAVCLCCGLLAGCGGGEKDGIKTSSDFDSATNQIKFIQGYRYEIPVNWEENNSTDTNFYFYPDNGMLMVSYEEAEGASITDENFRETYSQNVSNGFEKYELLSDYEREIAGQEAYCKEVNFAASGKDFKGEFVTFDYYGGIISFMMGTYSDSDINYDEDFEKIINSIEKVTVEGVMKKLEKSGIPIEYQIIYTDETDPNGEGNHDYLEKGNFADSRIEENYSKEEPLSGSIEVFRTDEEAVARADYLESLSALDSFAYRIISGNILLRLNDNYTDDQIQEFVNIIDGSVHSKSSSDFGDLKESLNQAEEPKETESAGYSGGMYKIGADMPAGEYLITSAGGYLEVSSDSSGSLDSIITNDNYTNRTYITVQEGQYLKFDGTAIPVADAAGYTASGGTYPEGMYLVGKDIPAGEYKISSSGRGYYEVSANSSGTLDAIITNENFDSDVYLTVSDGQYLKLNRAQIKTQ